MEGAVRKARPTDGYPWALMNENRPAGKCPMKHITVVTPCYNEETNIRPLYEAIRGVFEKLPQYTYDQIYIDNCSRDRSRVILRELAAEDPRVKVIFNTRNFGHIRSPYHGLLQSEGD